MIVQLRRESQLPEAVIVQLATRGGDCSIRIQASKKNKRTHKHTYKRVTQDAGERQREDGMREGGREEWPQVLLVFDCISATQSPGRRCFSFVVLLYETKLPAAGAFVFVFLEHNTPVAGAFPFFALLYETNPPGRM